MKANARSLLVSVCIAAVLLWAFAGGFGTARQPLLRFAGTARAADPKTSNPCNPDAAKTANPCNPDAAKAANPCNPDAGAAATNPCNPDAAKAANPCNPDAAKAANPCNPNAGAAAANPCNPDAGAAATSATANPCNPDAGAPTASAAATQAGLHPAGAKIDWGQDFHTWDVVTGYVLSNSHGNRLVRTYITPAEAAKVFKHNAQRALERRADGYESYPPGTRIVQESWLRNDLGGPGTPGPVFLMRKENPGFDAAGGDWNFAITRSDLSLLGEGNDGKMQFCKECHAQASRRDHVYSTER